MMFLKTLYHLFWFVFIYAPLAWVLISFAVMIPLVLLGVDSDSAGTKAVLIGMFGSPYLTYKLWKKRGGASEEKASAKPKNEIPKKEVESVKEEVSSSPSYKSKGPIEVNWNLNNEIRLLKNNGSKVFSDPIKVKPTSIDDFIISGRFNSVLGPYGFMNFNKEVKQIVKDLNAKGFDKAFLSLDKTYEILLASGVYYLDENLPDDLLFLRSNDRWLTAYRYVAKNFPEINRKDFREIVRRFADSRGYSIYVDPSDENFMKSMNQKTDLFKITRDIKASFMQLNMNQLRDICKKVGASPSNSLSETSDRLIEMLGDEASCHLPKGVHARETLTIVDTDLATGNDILQLDLYLKTMAECFRKDLIEYFKECRKFSLSA